MIKKSAFSLSFLTLALVSVGAASASFIVNNSEEQSKTIDNIPVDVGDVISKDGKYASLLKDISASGFSYVTVTSGEETNNYICEDDIHLASTIDFNNYKTFKSELLSSNFVFELISSNNAFTKDNFLSAYFKFGDQLLTPKSEYLSVEASRIKVSFPFANSSYSGLDKFISESEDTKFNLTFDFDAIDTNLNAFGDLTFKISIEQSKETI